MVLLPKLSDSLVYISDPIVHLTRKHSDSRGSILPLADEDMKSAVIISSFRGTIRANHYHKSDWHYCYLLTGCMDYFHRPVGDQDQPRCVAIRPGVLFFTPPMVEHAMVFLEDSTFICLGKNSREQISYESDVVRIPLVSSKYVESRYGIRDMRMEHHDDESRSEYHAAN